MMWGLGWISNIPDGRDFYSYFYSPNIGMSNDARMRLAAIDALFEAIAARCPKARERTALFDKMNDLIFDYAPWILTDYPYTNVVAQPWLKGYKLNTRSAQQLVYYDVAAHLRAAVALIAAGADDAQACLALRPNHGLGCSRCRFAASSAHRTSSRLSMPSSNVLSHHFGLK